MLNSKLVGTPVDCFSPKPKTDDELKQLQAPFDGPCYCQVVGNLQYLSITRPDLAYAMSKVAQHMHNPTLANWIAIKRILRCLAGTSHCGIYIRKCSDLSLSVYCDADWGDDKTDRKSTTSYVVFAGPNLISWSSWKQRAISRSSTEFEYRALATSTSEVLWLISLLKEIGFPPTSPPKLWCDNLGATYLISNLICHTRSRHLESEFHFILDLVAKKQLVIHYISTHDQVADLLTKPLPKDKF